VILYNITTITCSVIIFYGTDDDNNTGGTFYILRHVIQETNLNVTIFKPRYILYRYKIIVPEKTYIMTYGVSNLESGSDLL